MKKPKYDKITNFTLNKNIFWIKINDITHYNSIYNFLKRNKYDTTHLFDYYYPNAHFLLILNNDVHLYSKYSYDTSRFRNKPIKTLEMLQNEIR